MNKCNNDFFACSYCFQFVDMETNRLWFLCCVGLMLSRTALGDGQIAVVADPTSFDFPEDTYPRVNCAATTHFDDPDSRLKISIVVRIPCRFSKRMLRSSAPTFRKRI